MRPVKIEPIRPCLGKDHPSLLPLFRQTLVTCWPFFGVIFLSIVVCLTVRWLDSSFAFFALALYVVNNANVLPKALAYFYLIIYSIIGFIIFSINSISSFVNLYFVYNCLSISCVDLLLSVLIFSAN